MSNNTRNVFSNAQARAVVRLNSKGHNASSIRRILAADGRTTEGQLRDKRVFPSPMTVSLGPILAALKDAGVELRRGRPSKAVDTEAVLA